MTQAATCRTWGHARKTASANTIINILMPPVPKKKSKLTYFEVATSTTAHTLTVLRALNQTTFNADAAAAQTTVVLKADPGVYVNKRTANDTLASGDYLVYKCPDGSFVVDTVNGAPTVNGDGTVTVVMTTNVPTGGVKAGATVWYMGILTDTDPNSHSAEAHPVFTLSASSLNTKRASEGSVVESILPYSPLLIQCNNATAASVIESLQGVYGP